MSDGLAGATDRGPTHAERRGSSPLRLSAVLAGIVLSASGCNGHGSTSSVLLDGSRARAPHVELQGVRKPGVLTRVHVVNASNVPRGSLAHACLEGGPFGDARPLGRVVERVGLDGESVTFREPAGLGACDRTKDTQAARNGWCGSSFGRMYGGHLRDARLDIAGCADEDAAPIAFACIEPVSRARYVVVAGPDESEVYGTAAGLPIRISTRDVEADLTGARFHVTEFDDRGRFRRRLALESMPAG